MKNTLIIITLLIGFIGFAQENPEYKQDAIALVKLQSESSMLTMLEPLKNQIPEENQAAFMEEVKRSLEKIYPSLATIYMETFTHHEIEEIMTFYNSAVGKKMVEQMPNVLEKSMQIGQQWGMTELQPIMQKYK